MDDPEQSFPPQPHTYDGTYWVPTNPSDCRNPHDTNDFCGVHINNGVPNKMFYLLSRGGTQDSVTVTGIGALNALKIMYRANDLRWSDTTSTLASAALASVLSAHELDNTANWAKQTGRAWKAVKVCTAVPGDATASNSWTLGDVIAIVNYIFNKPGCSPVPACWLADGLVCRGDANGNGTVTLGDIIRMINYIFNKPCPIPGQPPSGCWIPWPSGTCCGYF